MTALQANCPACGAEITFKSGSSIVLVCEYCQSVVARTDRALEDLGKVAEVVETGSPLDVGLKGVYRGVAFELTGRSQLGHAAGGMWDEWYAAFADGRWGWLAEAQGRFYLTFQQETPEKSFVPPFDDLELGEPVVQIPGPVPLMVAEKGEARMLGAKGEIPYRLVPGEMYLYADLSGQGGAFGTLDYGETPPLVFVGREVTLTELGIVEAARAPEREARRVAAAQLQCPQCAGPLELRAPDRSERVTCPNCGSLLDVTQGRLKFLKALEPGKFTPAIPIGTVGEFDGGKLTVIGFMVRSVEFEGTRYFWEEYLLYNPSIGFRWLVQSDNHWSFVQAVPPGDVIENDKTVQFRGKKFKIFQDAAARVEYVAGEFYWKVTVGEMVRAVDFVHPPEILSKEVTQEFRDPKGAGKKPRMVSTGEINWSLGKYVTVKEVERAFGVKNLPPPASTPAPNQPFPHSGIYKYWVLLVLITLVVGMFTLVTGARRKVFTQSYQLQLPQAQQQPSPGGLRPLPQPAPTNPGSDEGAQVIFNEPLRLEARRNVKVTARSNVDNNWLYIDGDLINEETGLVQQFSLPIEYYYGVEDGEAWSEGSREADVHLSALPAGTYTMRLEAQWENWRQPAPPQVSVQLEQGVPRLLNLFLALVALSALPLFVLIRHYTFEKNRWQESTFIPYDTEEENDE